MRKPKTPYPSVPEALAAEATAAEDDEPDGRGRRSHRLRLSVRDMRSVPYRPPDHDGRDGVLEDELLLSVGLKHHGILVEGPNAPGQLHPTQQVNRDAQSLFAGGVQEGILDILRRLAVFHSRSP